MSMMGTVVNGQIRIDGNPSLPEGAKVWVEFEEDVDFGEPQIVETHEEHLAILRQSIAESKSGGGGIEARQFLNELAIKYDLPEHVTEAQKEDLQRRLDAIDVDPNRGSTWDEVKARLQESS